MWLVSDLRAAAGAYSHPVLGHRGLRLRFVASYVSHPTEINNIITSEELNHHFYIVRRVEGEVG